VTVSEVACVQTSGKMNRSFPNSSVEHLSLSVTCYTRRKYVWATCKVIVTYM